MYFQPFYYIFQLLFLLYFVDCQWKMDAWHKKGESQRCNCMKWSVIVCTTLFYQSRHKFVAVKILTWEDKNFNLLHPTKASIMRGRCCKTVFHFSVVLARNWENGNADTRLSIARMLVSINSMSLTLDSRQSLDTCPSRMRSQIAPIFLPKSLMPEDNGAINRLIAQTL